MTRPAPSRDAILAVVPALDHRRRSPARPAPRNARCARSGATASGSSSPDQLEPPRHRPTSRKPGQLQSYRTMTEIDFAYFNFEHGGLVAGEDRFYSSGCGYRFDGLVRVAGDQGRWPHVLMMGEGDRYELAGGEGMWEAAAAMRAAGGRSYVPLACELPAEGLYAPVIFVDPQAIVIRRFYYHRLPDHAARYSNLLIATLPGRPWSEIFRVRTGHGALYGGDSRLADAMRLRRLADPALPTVVAMDWNSVPSGPLWEDTALGNPEQWGAGGSLEPRQPCRMGPPARAAMAAGGRYPGAGLPDRGMGPADMPPHRRGRVP